MGKVTLLCGLALTVAAAVPASAVVIDFNDLGSPTTSNIYGSITAGDYILTASGGFFRTWAGNSPNNADPSGYDVITNSPGTSVTLKRVDGGLFDFLSLDLADAFNNTSTNTAFNVAFHFVTALGAADQTVTVDGNPGLETFAFNQTFLTSVIFDAPFNGYVGFDNANVSASAVVAPPGAVPEPASWAMMLAGFGLLGGTVRNRRRQEKRAAV